RYGCHSVLPGRPILHVHRTVAAVIEDEAGVGTLVDEFRGVEQLTRPHAQVEALAPFAEQTHAAHELRSEAVSGWRALAVQHLTNALDEIETAIRCEILREAIRRGPAGDD